MSIQWLLFMYWVLQYFDFSQRPSPCMMPHTSCSTLIWCWKKLWGCIPLQLCRWPVPWCTHYFLSIAYGKNTVCCLLTYCLGVIFAIELQTDSFLWRGLCAEGSTNQEEFSCIPGCWCYPSWSQCVDRSRSVQPWEVIVKGCLQYI